MAKKSEAIAKVETASLDIAQDELSLMLDDMDLGSDGLEEVDQDDISLPVKVFNMKGVDESGDPIPKNAFYDTITEETQKQIDAVLLTLHKTNEWREFSEKEDKSIVHCRSLDRVIGIMSDGTERRCKGCPDAKWTTDADGKRSRRCGEVYNVVGVERLTQRPFVVRFKKTSLRPFKNYLNKHFIGRRAGGRGHVPLFAYQTVLGLEMHKSGIYSMPVLTRGDQMDKASIQSAADMAKFYREVVLPETMSTIVDGDASDDDTAKTIDADEFVDRGGNGDSSQAAANF